MKHVFLVSMVVIPGLAEFNRESVAVDSIKSLGDGAECKIVSYHYLQHLGSALSSCVRLFGFDPDTFCYHCTQWR